MKRIDITAHINASARGFHDSMRRLRSDAERTGRSTAQSLAMIGSKLRGGASAVAGAAGLGAGLGAVSLGATVAAVGDVARGLAEVGDAAKRAGIDVQAFQELKFVAEQNRVGVDQLIDGIKELNLRADEFILTGQGSAAEAFQRLGYDAEELRDKLEEPNELFIEIIGRLQDLDRAAQIRIADEIFGGSGGEQFVQLIEQGEQGLRDTMQTARDLGVVMSEELIEKADELDRMFRTVTQTVGNSLQKAIINAASALVTFVDSFREFENQQNRTLDKRMRDIGLERVEIENEILRIKEEQSQNTSVLAQAEARLSEGQIASMQARAEALAAEEKRILDVLKDRRAAQVKLEVPKFQETTVSPSASSGGGASGGSGGRDHSVTSLERERDAVRQLITELEEELALIGQSDQARRAAEASRRAGSAATETERAQIVSLNEAIHREQQVLERANEARAQFTDTAMDGFSELASVIDTGNEALDRMLGSLIEAVAQAALLGEGPLASLGSGLLGDRSSGGGFGSLLGGVGKLIFGGTRERGGTVTPGRMYRVNEKGEEFFSPGGPGVIHPAGSVDGGIQITYAPQIDARGADSAAIARLEAQMAKDKAEFPYRVQRAVAEGRATRAIR